MSNFQSALLFLGLSILSILVFEGGDNVVSRIILAFRGKKQ